MRNHSILAHPLQSILDGYSSKDRNHRIKWTDALKADYETLKAAVSDCQKLYFLIDTMGNVHLQTDASDYGIGAYLFQITPEGDHHPIMFMSKSLNPVECRWSTPEKEMFGIWFALKKMEHLIRDIPFTLHTDHENLIHDRTSGSPKVLRWKLDIQQFDFTIQHIKGEDNTVADALSRLCEKEDVEYCAALNEEECVTDYLIQEIKTAKRKRSAPEYIELAASTEIKSIPSDIHAKIALVHNSMTGHHGVERTLLKLVRAGHKWPYMREHIRLFIKKCPCCQKMSVLSIPIKTTPFVVATDEPMSTVNIDSIGPLPVDEDGNQHVLTVIDTCTRHVELYAIHDVTAEGARRALVDYIGRYGCPTRIQSDNGPQFVNDVIADVVRIIGTEHVKTLAYSKEENAIVERANKEVLRHLRALVFAVGTNTDWSLRLPLVARIMNSTVNETTGVTPASLLFGNTINLDRGIFLPLGAIPDLDEPIPKRLSQWSADMLRDQQRLLSIALNRQLVHQTKHLQHDETKITSYAPNSYVLVQYPDGPLGHRPTDKLKTNLKGPYRVISNVGAKYKLWNFVTNDTVEHHIKDLRPYEVDEQFLSPNAVALKDKGEFVVESIVAHSGKPTRKSDMDFLVRWEGYTAVDDQWLPWRQLRNNPKLHEYLRQHGFQKIIPKEHRLQNDNA